MKIAEVFGFVDSLKLVQGVENNLRARRRFGTWAALAAVAMQIVTVAVDKNYFEKLGRFFFNLVNGQWKDIFTGDGRLYSYEIVAALMLVGGAAAVVLVRRTRFLLRDSKEPFRYTFSVDPFLCVSVCDASAEKPGEGLAREPSGQFRLLHHDLMSKLNSNIRRLSLLDLTSLSNTDRRDLSSHIHISGHYLISRTSVTADVYRIEVMPRIRIGARDRPQQLAPRVCLTDISFKGDLAESDYSHVVEHVYSRIATAVYQRIREDIKSKINLYPTPYVRAVGLFYEAEDFEQSNTVDAYDHAIDLYREALRYFDVRRLKVVSQWLLWSPVLWRLVNESQLTEARARVLLSVSD